MLGDRSHQNFTKHVGFYLSQHIVGILSYRDVLVAQ